MTQEQLIKIEEKADSLGYYEADTLNIFTVGAKAIISNPTDFGLVSMETMFEFAEWTRDQEKYYFNKDERVWRERKWNDKRYTTPELFQLFTTQNKEK